MLPDFFQIMSLTADLVLFLFVGYYMMRLYARERELEKKEKKTDNEYHQVVDDALSKERKILDDATSEASQIISETEFVSQSSKDSIDAALAQMKKDIQNETATAAHTFRTSYQQELKKLTDQSLDDFQSISKEMQESLRKQVVEFHTAMLPALEKELEVYKQTRMKQTEQMIKGIIQKVSQQVLTRTISTDDHQKLLLEALDKAKQEGMFD